MLTTVILIIKQFMSSLMPRGIRLDCVLREVCCHDFISSLEQQESKIWCDDAESKVALGWSQLWERVGDSVSMTKHTVDTILEPKNTSNTAFNSRKRIELEFTFRDSVLRPWVIFRQAVGDDVQFSSTISFEKHNEPYSHCAFFYSNFEPKRKNG